jgi:hypothetical protein
MPVAGAKGADDLPDQHDAIRQDTETDENDGRGGGEQELQVAK